MSKKYTHKIGDKTGRLTFISDLGIRIIGTGYKKRFGLYQCECGNKIEIRCSDVKNGTTCSCGCLNTDKITKHNLCHHKIYKTYWYMKQRCYNEKHTHYKCYGGRGIMICDEWLNDFVSFYDWATNNGWEEGLQIDRINNDGNYEPSNCQWITNTENCSVGKRRTPSNNSSGYIGISFDNKKGKWSSDIMNKGIRYRLGSFENIEDAIKIRINKEIELLGEQKSNLHYGGGE